MSWAAISEPWSHVNVRRAYAATIKPNLGAVRGDERDVGCLPVIALPAGVLTDGHLLAVGERDVEGSGGGGFRLEADDPGCSTTR